MRSIDEIKKQPRVHDMQFLYLDDYKCLGGYIDLYDCGAASFICSIDEPYNHVSVSPMEKQKVPTWKDMSLLKKTFFKDDEDAIQIHPKEAEYFHKIKGLENVLHLWAPKDGDWNELMNNGNR